MIAATFLIGLAIGILGGAWLSFRSILVKELNTQYQAIRKDEIALTRFLRDEIRKISKE